MAWTTRPHPGEGSLGTHTAKEKEKRDDGNTHLKDYRKTPSQMAINLKWKITREPDI